MRAGLLRQALTADRSIIELPARAICARLVLKREEEAHAPGGIAARSGASAISHDRRRYAFGHVVWADADALQARPSSNGRQVLPQPPQLPSQLLFQRSSRLTDVPWRPRQQYALFLHSRISRRSVHIPGIAGRSLCGSSSRMCGVVLRARLFRQGISRGGITALAVCM